MLRDKLRRLGPIAWRDTRITELQTKIASRDARIAELRDRVGKLDQQVEQLRAERSASPPYRPDNPSWHIRIMEQQRVQRAVNALDGAEHHPRRNLFGKLHNYAAARSHGVATPQVLGVWREVAEVSWDALPDHFVLKSNGGSTARGVLPLERTGNSFRLVDGTRTLRAEDIITHFAQARGARGPFFAETLLSGSDERLPDDIKIYVFYGQVAYVMVRRMPVHGALAQARVHMVTPSGEYLDVVQRGRDSDAGVPVPAQLPLMVETATVLSLAVPLPFVRVDLYASGPDGVVLGELTPLPGDSQTFTRAWDKRLGRMYDEAEARLQVDLTSGRPYEVLYGTHDRALSAPLSPTTTAPLPPRWEPQPSQ